MNIHVVVTFQFEGFHNWPGCPLPEVSFLEERHRHIFHVKAYKPVSHDDRDVEIILLKRSMLLFISTFGHLHGPAELGSMSCEMLAKELINHFDLSQCEVLEDGENGAAVTA